jgi:hypothetical protein
MKKLRRFQRLKHLAQSCLVFSRELQEFDMPNSRSRDQRTIPNSTVNEARQSNMNLQTGSLRHLSVTCDATAFGRQIDQSPFGAYPYGQKKANSDIEPCTGLQCVDP